MVLLSRRGAMMQHLIPRNCCRPFADIVDDTTMRRNSHDWISVYDVKPPPRTCSVLADDLRIYPQRYDSLPAHPATKRLPHRRSCQVEAPVEHLRTLTSAMENPHASGTQRSRSEDRSVSPHCAQRGNLRRR